MDTRDVAHLTMKLSFHRSAESTAWLSSVAVHLVLTVALGLTTIVLPRQLNELSLALENITLPDEEALAEEFVASDLTPDEIGADSQNGTDSALASAMKVDDTSLVLFEHEPASDFGERHSVDVATPVFRGPELSDRLPVQGAGSVGITGAMGAIDRITQEILTSVEQQPTLVAWLFDESGSLKGERQDILKRFRRVYEELGVIEAADNPAFNNHEDKPLLTAVAGFGEEVTLYTPRPTDRIEEIESAVENIGDSNSRYEFVFQAIADVAEKFRSYRLNRKNLRNVMIVVFTDESGDDFDQHEATIHLCQKLAIPVYVTGRPAPFGRETAYVKWIDPDPHFDQRPQWVPVSSGPETLVPEVLKLFFVGSRGHEEQLDSGFGPYGLTKLCYETGGLYFAVHPNRAVGRHVSGYETNNLTAHFAAFFEPDVMKKYQPDYFSESEYRRQLKKNRAQAALVEAAQMSWATPLDDFDTRFPRRDDAALAADLSRAQRAAAIRQPELDRLRKVLLDGEADRDKLRSARWQAGYDLALGRALAAKVRNDGYNVMLAEAKQGMAFRDEANNTWQLGGDAELANSTLEKLGEQAERLLRQVVAEHPGTPWAMLAERELTTPLGWRWQETYTFIPELAQPDPNAAPPQPQPEVQRPEPLPRRDPPPL
jgi:hypothetical protein